MRKKADGAFYDTKKDRETVEVERRAAELADGSDSPRLACGDECPFKYHDESSMRLFSYMGHLCFSVRLYIFRSVAVYSIKKHWGASEGTEGGVSLKKKGGIYNACLGGGSEGGRLYGGASGGGKYTRGARGDCGVVGVLFSEVV